MFEYILTIVALIAVLLIPGPTNTMLAYASSKNSIKQTVSLITTVLIGYFYAIALWRFFINMTADIWPAWSDILYFISIIYVFWLAIRLWKMNKTDEFNYKYKNIPIPKLFYSILKNPKALLIAVGIFPHSTWDNMNNYGLSMLIFALILIPCTLFWILFGHYILKGNLRGLEQEQLYRSSALFLMICMLPIIVRFFH